MSTSRLTAAQTARAAAKRAFHLAVEDATQDAIRRGVRGLSAIDAAVEADPAVIAARIASKASIEDLRAAEEAATADERLATVETAARLDATTLGEGADRADPAAHTEGSDDVVAVAIAQPATPWTEIAALSVEVATAEYTALRDRRATEYAASRSRPTQGPGTHDATIAAEEYACRVAVAGHATTELRAHLLSRRARGLGLHASGCSLCASVAPTGRPS